jgi:hypothetical protein
VLEDVAGLAPELADVLPTSRFRSLFVATAGILAHPLSTHGRERLEGRPPAGAGDPIRSSAGFVRAHARSALP